MKLKEICDLLEQWAPLSYQEEYDNSGLLVGDPEQEIKGLLVSLDCLEEIVEEAIQKKCNLIVSHHPIIFKGLKSLTGQNYIERTLLKAIKNNIALYAIHTNLDNIQTGVNAKIAEKLELINTKVLVPKKKQLKQLITYIPKTHTEIVKQALFSVGAGALGDYSECSYTVEGCGTFKGGESSNPHIGEKQQLTTVIEDRLEIVFPTYLESKVVSKLKSVHPYEEVAYGVVALNNEHFQVGSGMIGELDVGISEKEFLNQLKTKFNANCIRHTALLNRKVKKIAVCGGSGSFLLDSAKKSLADVYVTSDFKYHEFFDAENQILIADIGHYESEQYTKDLIADFLRKNFPKFAVHLSEVNTNPVNYL